QVVFTDAPMSASELMGQVGKVAFAAMAGLVAKSAAAEMAPPQPTQAPAPNDTAAPPRPAAAEATDAPPPNPAPPPPANEGLATPVADSLTEEADFKARPSDPPPPPTPVMRGQFDAPPQASAPPPPPSNDNPPAPPPPPPETIAIDLSWRNVSGQTTASQDGKTLITGAGGSARSAADPSPEAQAEREMIIGTSGDDVIVGDNTQQLGSGFARQLDIQLSAKLPLEVTGLLRSGLPKGLVVVGATQRGDNWAINLPADFSANGNHASVVLQYAVATDGQAFTPASFELSVSAVGVMD
ncbi:MAG: hypothetical protein CFE45_34235, partial [Burkholderiales bacterium PBB5]